MLEDIPMPFDEENVEGAKFRVGDCVRIVIKENEKRRDFLMAENKKYVIIGVNEVDEESIEYRLRGFPWLLWEEELEAVTSDTTC